MLTALLTSINVILVFLVLIGVALLLLVINYYTYSEDEKEEYDSISRLRHDIKDDDSVITHDSLFHLFLARGERQSRNIGKKHSLHR